LAQEDPGNSFLATEGPLAELRVVDGRVLGTLGEEEEEMKRRQAAVPRRVSVMGSCISFNALNSLLKPLNGVNCTEQHGTQLQM
jgi:hypothetical protein